MLHSRNIEDVLKQGLNPVRTTSKSLLASSLILPSGAPLSSYMNPKTQDELSTTQLKMYSLYAANFSTGITGMDDDENGGSGEGEEQDGKKSDVSKVETEDYDIYLKEIKDTPFKVVLVSEKGYPQQIIRLKLDNLAEAFEDLKKFEYTEDDED